MGTSWCSTCTRSRRPRASTATSGSRSRAVTAVRVVGDAWPELRGIRAPGTGVPEVIAVGTRRGGFGKDFAAVHGKGPAVVVELEGAEYGRLIVTSDDAAAVAAAIGVATGRD